MRRLSKTLGVAIALTMAGFSSTEAMGQSRPAAGRSLSSTLPRAEAAGPNTAQLAQVGVGTRPSPQMQAAMSSQGASSIPIGARVRTLSSANLRANPRLDLGGYRIDFRPVFNNPRSLSNIAAAMKARPDLFASAQETLTVEEHASGVIIRSSLTYKMQPEACRGANREVVRRLGIGCATRRDGAATEAAMSNRRDPRFIANAGLRRERLASLRAQYAAQTRHLEEGVGQFRSAVSDGRRSQLLQALGAQRLAQLEAMTDEELIAEAVNTAETTIHQEMTVPSEGETVTQQSAKSVEVSPPTLEAAQYSFGPYTYVTGFTLQRQYVWKQKIEARLNLCYPFDCASTYHVGAEAGFYYGFGLRFPLTLSGTYDFSSSGTARLTTDFDTVNGKERHFADAGLGDIAFGGKELVAGLGGYAAVDIKLPLGVKFNESAGLDIDLTQLLPPPYRGGDINPPSPGKDDGEGASFILRDLDLLAGYGSYGVAGVKAFPALKVNLYSDGLAFSLRDQVANRTIPMTQSGRSYELGVDPAKGYRSRFAIENPVYNLGFKLTPGVNAYVYVNLGLWDQDWDLEIWFPELAVVLPPGGIDFSCHANSICSRNFTYTPAGGGASGHGVAGEADGRGGLDAALTQWATSIDTQMRPRCSDAVCRSGLDWVKQGLIGQAQLDYDFEAEEIRAGRRQPPNRVTFASLSGRVSQARAQAEAMVRDSAQRQSRAAAEHWVNVLIEHWSKNCVDAPCYADVTRLANEMPALVGEEARRNPDSSSTIHQGVVSRDYGPRFRAAVEASKARVAEMERRAAVLEAARQSLRVAPPVRAITVPGAATATSPQLARPRGG